MMEKGIVYSTSQKFSIKLIIVEWVKNLYWNFEWGSTVRMPKSEELIWYCTEEVGWDWYCEFEKLKYEYQRDIVDCLIKQKKRDNTYALFSKKSKDGYENND